MRYRPFGGLGYDVSALGFGCMRLPTVDGKIDEDHATRMLHYAIDHGVNYLDTAYPYHGGESEPFVGRVLRGGYRERVHLATKLLCRSVHAPDDFERLLTEQLGRLQTEYLDVYLLHGLNRERWERVRDMGVLRWLDGVRSSGRVGAVGFSFHDTFPVFQEIVDAYDWQVCQIQYNYMNEEFQAGTEGLRYAASKGLAIVVMEPLLGGKLASAPPAVQSVWDSAPARRTPAEWALQWVWSHPEVSLVLSGMSAMSQVEENVDSAGRSGPGGLSSEDLRVIERVRDTYNSLSAVPCTSCGYCMPCPNGVDIPRTFTILNNGVMFGNMEEARRRYTHLLSDQSPEILASSCVQCRQCEEECPQGIPISEWMPYAHAVLGEGQPFDRDACPK
jgi:uncharacterized protein